MQNPLFFISEEFTFKPRFIPLYFRHFTEVLKLGKVVLIRSCRQVFMEGHLKLWLISVWTITTITWNFCYDPRVYEMKAEKIHLGISTDQSWLHCAAMTNK